MKSSKRFGLMHAAAAIIGAAISALLIYLPESATAGAC